MRRSEIPMKKSNAWRLAIWVASGALGLMPGLGAAQEEAAVAEEAEVAPIEQLSPYILSAGLVHHMYSFSHDALQQRSDYVIDRSDAWREGDTDGEGWGVSFMVKRDEYRAQLVYLKSDYTYKRHNGSFTHEIDTDRRDLELTWSKEQQQTKYGVWGSTLGFHYTGTSKAIDITENSDHLRMDGDVTWLMLMAGYFAEWKPFQNDLVRVFGKLHGMVGESEGLSRMGSDSDELDGDIVETYEDDYSIAYGANAMLGMGYQITKRISAIVDYRREWMYSFDATDSGTIVFPDNNDALHIENYHGVRAYVMAEF